MRQLLKELLYIPEYGKMREKAFLNRIAVSVLSMVFCLFAMGFTAYAWFTSGVMSNANTIVAAHYALDWEITVTVDDAEQTSVNTAIVADEIPQIYRVHIEENEDSTASTGFCVVCVDVGNDGTVEEVYHTVQIGKDINAEGGERKSLDFTVTAHQPAKITFTAHWGTSSNYYNNDSEQYIEENGAITVAAPVSDTAEEETGTETNTQTEPTETVYTVQEGDTLIGIADLYATTYERIVAYNELEDPRIIIPGQQLKIPPADWEMPADWVMPAASATEQDTSDAAESTDPEAAEATGSTTEAEPATTGEKDEESETVESTGA